MGHNTTTPSPHCSARVLRGRLADTPRGEKHAGHAPRYSYAATQTVRSPCRRPVAVLLRSSLGRRCGEERALRWATSQPRQVRTAQRACSVGYRPMSCGVKCGRAMRHGIQTRRVKPVKDRAADLSPCWCGRASADVVGRSVPRVGPQRNQPSPHCAASVLRERSANTSRGENCAGRTPQYSNVTVPNVRIPCR